MLISMVAVLVSSPPSRDFLNPGKHLLSFVFLDFGHSAWGKMKSQSRFDLHFLDGVGYQTFLKIFLSSLCFIF